MRQVLIGHILQTAILFAYLLRGDNLLLSNHATLVACLDSFSCCLEDLMARGGVI